MRLWHKDLIRVLPKDQIIGQWRECCAIANNLAVHGTPNHVLVNKIICFPVDHFYTYSLILLRSEFAKRNYHYNDLTMNSFIDNLITYSGRDIFTEIDHKFLFQGWHSTRYLQQCLLNLEEKYDCGAIDLKDWFKIVNHVHNMSKLCEDTYNSLFA